MSRKKKKIPGTLRRRSPSGPWHYIVYINGRYCEKSTGETDQKKAWGIAEESLYPQAQLLHAAPRGLPRLSEAIVREVRRVEESISTRQASRVSTSLMNFLKWHGDSKITRITKHQINEYQRHRLNVDKVSSDTVRKERCAIMRLLSRYEIRIDPPDQIKTVKTEVRAFTDEELAAFFAVKMNPAHRVLYLTMLATGARPAELLPSRRSKHTALLKSEIDYERRIIMIRSAKLRAATGKIREIHVSPDLLDLLEEQAASQPGEFVFASQTNLDRNFDIILARAGIPKIDDLGRKLVAHSFRHTYATKMARLLDPFELRDSLGHHRIETTNRYVSSANSGHFVDISKL